MAGVASSPACTELETIVLDWFGKALSLPPEFLFYTEGSKGGGVIQGSASECLLVSMLAARAKAIKYLMKKDGNETGQMSEYLPKIVAYCSKEAHSCVEKAALILLVRLRILEVTEDGCLDLSLLKEAIEEDRKNGLHPFFVSSTVGTTGSCSFDDINGIGQIVKDLPAFWFHVDGAYGGSSFICPEMREPLKGMHYADSFNINPNKSLLTAFDCSCLWVKDRIALTSALTVDPLYLQHENSNVAVDYRHWQLQLSRRFRSLKLWFMFRSYGIEGLQMHIRNFTRLAKHFEKLVMADNRFEVCNTVKLGLVCFRLKGSDSLNQELLACLNSSGEIHMVPCLFKNKYTIRFSVNYQYSTPEVIETSWKIIQTHATNILETVKEKHRELERKPSERHSFVCNLPRKLYEKRVSKNSLHDGGMPIIFAEDGNHVDSLK